MASKVAAGALTEGMKAGDLTFNLIPGKDVVVKFGSNYKSQTDTVLSRDVEDTSEDEGQVVCPAAVSVKESYGDYTFVVETHGSVRIPGRSIPPR